MGLIADGILIGPHDLRMALRSLKAPGTAYDEARLGRDPLVANMADYVRTEDDNGGVHIRAAWKAVGVTPRVIAARPAIHG